MRARIALVTAFICAVTLTGMTYNAYDTHYKIVIDAIDYMYHVRAGADVTYPDGWTAEKDRYVAKWWTGELSSISQSVDIPTELEKATAEVDYRHDLGLYVNEWLCRKRYGISTVYDTSFVSRHEELTGLMHFVNASAPPDFWVHDGYFYLFSNQNGADHDAMVSAGTFLPLVVACGLEIDNKRAPAYWRYKQPDLLVSDAYYEMNAESPFIPMVRFPPVGNMAAYWWDRMMEVAPEATYLGYLPPQFDKLGYVLHALADVAVPHHALGFLGEGHVDYEDFVEALFVPSPMGVIYDPTIIRKHLTERPFLNVVNSVKDMVEGEAAYVVAQEIAAGRRSGNGRFHPGDGDINRVRDLVNLSIASSVAVLRKAWLEYGTRYDVLNPESKWTPPKLEPPTIPTEPVGPGLPGGWGRGSWRLVWDATQEREMARISGQSTRSVRAAPPPLVRAPVAEPSLAALGPGTLYRADFRTNVSKALMARLDRTTDGIKHLLTRASEKSISQEDFGIELAVKQKELSETMSAALREFTGRVPTSGAEAEPSDTASSGQHSYAPRFQPSTTDVSTVAAWQAYTLRARRYRAVAGLLEMTVLRALLDAEWEREADLSRKDRLSERIVQLERMKALAASEFFH